MNFGEAIEAAKNEFNIARAGWNGKNMMVWIKKGSVAADAPPAADIGGVSGDLFDTGDKGTSTRMPCFCMKAADGSTVEGWLASQTDMLAEDWTAFE